jgi:hypothetical protein
MVSVSLPERKVPKLYVNRLKGEQLIWRFYCVDAYLRCLSIKYLYFCDLLSKSWGGTKVYGFSLVFLKKTLKTELLSLGVFPSLFEKTAKTVARHSSRPKSETACFYFWSKRGETTNHYVCTKSALLDPKRGQKGV